MHLLRNDHGVLLIWPSYLAYYVQLHYLHRWSPAVLGVMCLPSDAQCYLKSSSVYVDHQVTTQQTSLPSINGNLISIRLTSSMHTLIAQYCDHNPGLPPLTSPSPSPLAIKAKAPGKCCNTNYCYCRNISTFSALDMGICINYFVLLETTITAFVIWELWILMWRRFIRGYGDQFINICG